MASQTIAKSFGIGLKHDPFVSSANPDKSFHTTGMPTFFLVSVGYRFHTAVVNNGVLNVMKTTGSNARPLPKAFETEVNITDLQELSSS